MSIELTLLVWSVALAFVQVLVAVAGASGQVDFATLAGNREGLPALTGWAGRAQRAHRNMLENLPLFIALVLVAQIAGRTNGMTALGAQLFFWGRLAHAIIYVAGVPWLRTLAWLVSVIGLILIFLQLL
ncbi:MAG TPA: MAPEG family protein [Stellaceae bacterium]|nr:MAPEG family protein [Stellaceae bacterium]